MKNCFKCGVEKPLSDFYKHGQMYDGHVNKCKECNKNDVRKNREVKVEYYRAYDVKRGSRKTSGQTKEYRTRYPNKYKAQTMVGNAIRDGKLFRLPCESCDRVDSHAHHDDYLKPLNVRWLCPVHHSEWHQLNGEGLNG